MNSNSLKSNSMKKNYNRENISNRKCSNCLNNGHESKDCLIKPIQIKISSQNMTPLCEFCGSSNHYICPMSELYIISDYNSDEEDLDNSPKKSRNYIKNFKVDKNNFISIVQFFLNEKKKFEEIKKNNNFSVKVGNFNHNIKYNEIKNNNFCCKCGKTHFYKKCGKNFIKKNYFNEENDDCFIRIKNLNNLIHYKNPLKYEPIMRNDYKIDHKDIKSDYYNQIDSSGESFQEMYK